MPLILGGTLLAGGVYIKAKLTDISTLKENNAKLLIAQQEQKLVLKKKETEMLAIVASYERQKNINKVLEENMINLKSKFNKIKEDGSKRGNNGFKSWAITEYLCKH